MDFSRNRTTGFIESILFDEEGYLLPLVCYIHLNPLRAGLVDGFADLDTYPWTGHSALMGKREATWQHTGAVLSRFGGSVRTARHRYRKFIEQWSAHRSAVDYSGGGLIRSYGGWQAVAKARREHIRKVGDERLLGDSEFVEQALAQDPLDLDEPARYAGTGWNLAHLIEAVCDHFAVDTGRVQDKGRANALSNAKAVICFLSSKKLGLPSSEIARRLALSQSGVSGAAQRGRIYCDKHRLSISSLRIRKSNV